MAVPLHNELAAPVSRRRPNNPPGARGTNQRQPVDDRGVTPEPIGEDGGVARFLTLVDVTEVLNISMAQARSLVRSGQLRAIQVGGRHQWRVERTELDAYIERMYEATDQRTGRKGSESR